MRRMVRRWPKPLVAEGIRAIVLRTICAEATLSDAILPEQCLGLPAGPAEVDVGPDRVSGPGPFHAPPAMPSRRGCSGVTSRPEVDDFDRWRHPQILACKHQLPGRRSNLDQAGTVVTDPNRQDRERERERETVGSLPERARLLRVPVGGQRFVR